MQAFKQERCSRCDGQVIDTGIDLLPLKLVGGDLELIVSLGSSREGGTTNLVFFCVFTVRLIVHL
jgi:hypothetical protein